MTALTASLYQLCFFAGVSQAGVARGAPGEFPRFASVAAGRGAREMPLQRGQQAEVVEHRRTQVEGGGDGGRNLHFEQLVERGVNGGEGVRR